MDDLRYLWDERKNRANQRKHGVAFEEARTAFLDENARRVSDPSESFPLEKQIPQNDVTIPGGYHEKAL